MSVAVLLRIGIVVTGLLIMWQSFYMHAVKKLAINLAVAWEGIGTVSYTHLRAHET